MKYSSKFKNTLKICILGLSCLSFYLATRESLFYRNLTYVGNLEVYRPLFLLWGFLQCFFFTFMGIHICLRYTKENYKKTRNIILFDAILNLIAYLLPYKHPGEDLISQIHVYLSFISSALAVLILLYILKEIFYKNMNVFQKCKNQIMILLSIIFFLAMLLGDFTGIMEIVYLNGISILMYTMLTYN